MFYKYRDHLVYALHEIKLLPKALNEPGKELIKKGFYCPCKKSLLKSYLYSISNLMIQISSEIQAIHTIKNGDELSDRFRFIWNIYKETESKIIYDVPFCTFSTCLFDIMQTQFEDVFMSELYKKLYPHINSAIKPHDSILQDILTDLIDVGETALFYLSGLHIKCSSINPNIVSDKFFKELNLNPIRFKTDFTECNLERKTGHECLHLFVTPAMLQINSWLSNYFDLYRKYHRDPKNIIMIIDYELMNDQNYKWDNIAKERYEKALEVFGAVYFINYENIDFDDYTGKVNLSDYEELSSCIV